MVRDRDPYGSATDGDGLGGADHAVEHLDSEGDLATLGGPAAGTELGPDQVLVATRGGFGLASARGGMTTSGGDPGCRAAAAQ